MINKTAVKISDVVYRNIGGTSASKVAVEFDCSKSIPCQGIVLKDINLVGAGGEATESSCKNVHGTAQGKIYIGGPHMVRRVDFKKT
ncbi:hypothetical protein ACLOJK_021280 [Asimina triloba]